MEIVGMIHYAPAEEAPLVGRSLHYVNCIWVHAYKQGVGDHRKKGIGKPLLAAAEEEARALGSKGMAAWGLRLPVFMRSAWFKKQGYRVADRDGAVELVWKPFAPDAEIPRLLRLKKKPSPGARKVALTCLRNGWCPAQDLVHERARRVALDFPSTVEFISIDTDDRGSLEEWGVADALFVDGSQVRTGPPPSAEAIRKLLSKSLKKRGLSEPSRA